MLKSIIKELRSHAPFTALGALTGIILIFLFHRIPAKVSFNLFYTLHPLHVFLSALVTSSIYRAHKKGNIYILLIIGYVGSVGIATLSDSLIPYLGEVLLDLPHRHAHIGFIEKWWLVNPLAIAGITIAYFKPRTRVPHFGHVLLSTWASLFHITMAAGNSLNWTIYLPVFIFLLLSVWLPCCLSDIAFPLLFIKEKKEGKSLANHN